MKDKHDNSKPLVFVERLTLASWVFSVLPYLAREKLKNHKTYYIDASRFGLFAARITMLFFPLWLEKLDFRLVDIRDDTGNMLRLRIAYFDFADVQRNILSNPVFQNIDCSQIENNRAATFFAKQTASFDTRVGSTIFRTQFLPHIAAWKRKREGLGESTACFLFISKRVWMKEIKQYASQYNVKIVNACNIDFNLKNIIKILAGSKLKLLQSMYFYIKKEGAGSFLKRIFAGRRKKDKGEYVSGDTGSRRSEGAFPKISVEYFGLLNLDNPQMHSDLFFWQESRLPAENILIAAASARNPLDKEKWGDIRKYGMSAVCLSPLAGGDSGAEIFYPWIHRARISAPKITAKIPRNTPEERWLRQQISLYSSLRDYWISFFDRHKVKIYVTWFKYDSSLSVIADALQCLGGVTVNYQRGFEEFSSPETAIDCDVAFGFSSAGAEVERGSNSRVPYYVVTGYLGDFRFPLLKQQAQKIRSSLQQKGARRIIAFFDENSGPDSRWHSGHEFMRVHYEFLLEEVLAKPWLGLVFKPKIPSTLRKRLGKVADLLKRAEDTGRCYVFEGNTLHSAYPPAIAALAADLAIHGDLAGATAGVEAVLTGTPTLLMDREGWPISKFYNLNKGRVAFNNWPDLWKVCQEHWNTDSGLPGFGDWTPILDELDPFRDGKAAQRMGTYLEWLLEGFKAGLSRDTVMADAAERYCKAWGKDKIKNISVEPYLTKKSSREAVALSV